MGDTNWGHLKRTITSCNRRRGGISEVRATEPLSARPCGDRFDVPDVAGSSCALSGRRRRNPSGLC